MLNSCDMGSCDQSRRIQQAVENAVAERTPVNIVAGNSKSFYGRKAQGVDLDVGGHRGIVSYHPEELVITARAGTPLVEIRQMLAEQGQMLAFEPPFFAGTATLGGAIACGFSGSRRPFSGSARDFVLGCRIIDGRGEIATFGGEVMKNVAGYDVSRLMVGAMGTLGVLLQASLKVLPIPQREMSCVFSLAKAAAMEKMQQLALQSLPLSALSFDGELLYVRLSGADKAVRAAAQKIGGEVLADDGQYWHDLIEQRLDFFQSDQPLWRISLAPATPELALTGDRYFDWGGALRWLNSEEPAEKVFAAAAAANGHATLFRNGDSRGQLFQPLHGKLRELQHRVKKTFDPLGIFNPQRLYLDW
ncbi:glycolate oxidase subunit GlcE [Methylomarinum sp. Ch1-1]|uniref:Glycolate oxidase subunit GlcE n=1 Tax=Methylomarinum roseum TaxID=3067653 RepID=A0AAU7NU12_9GAMM|nr:glycolate oxidase subunit GlcE [Methylomarinum sp. Ch1-1]MDP4519486.1 glycolate oxidase subunit GlcE [Methylomarinum sp. Ch1-1]